MGPAYNATVRAWRLHKPAVGIPVGAALPTDGVLSVYRPSVRIEFRQVGSRLKEDGAAAPATQSRQQHGSPTYGRRLRLSGNRTTGGVCSLGCHALGFDFALEIEHAVPFW